MTAERLIEEFKSEGLTVVSHPSRRVLDFSVDGSGYTRLDADQVDALIDYLTDWIADGSEELE